MKDLDPVEYEVEGELELGLFVAPRTSARARLVAKCGSGDLGDDPTRRYMENKKMIFATSSSPGCSTRSESWHWA